MARDSEGQYLIYPLHLAECVGVGATLEEATEAAQAALLDYLKTGNDDIIFPPIDSLDPEELAEGNAVRIEIRMPK